MSIYMISSLLSIAYLMPIVGRAYFRKPSEKDADLHEAPWMCVLPPCLTAIGCVLLFLFPEGLFDLLNLMFVEGGQ
jgi:multicomponent Na+:H+ antiporter subunit D